MNEVKLHLNAAGDGAFKIMDGAVQLGEMIVSVSGNDLSVLHTEVSTQAEGKGVAKTLLTEMVKYARENKMKVTPLCAFVHLQFRKHPDEYADIWKK